MILTTMTIRLEKSLLEQMKKLAKNNDRTLSAEVRIAMRERIKNQEAA